MVILLLKVKVMKEGGGFYGCDSADKCQGIKCGNAVTLKQIVCGKTWQHHGNHGEINVWICESVK